VDDARWAAFERKREAVEKEAGRLRSTWINTKLLAQESMQQLFGQSLERDYLAADLLKRPGVGYRDVVALPGAGPGIEDAQAAEQVEIRIKYQGYVDRQQEEVARRAQFEDWRLPADLDYATVRGLSREVQQKLNRHRPETVGQAERISGITPAAISLLLVHLKRGAKPEAAAKARAGGQAG
jgi:tRNA uridine 5-carboxymethylaminomethyl modification enzyme